MNLIGAEVARIHNGIYSVKLVDDELGTRVVHFVMPFFNEEAFHRIIAHLHLQWLKEGNAPGDPVPEINLEEVNRKVMECIESRKENDEKIESEDPISASGGHPAGLIDPMGLADPSDPESGDPGGPPIKPDEDIWSDGGDDIPGPRNEPPVVAHERGNPAVAGPEAGEGQPPAGPAVEGGPDQPGAPDAAGETEPGS